MAIEDIRPGQQFDPIAEGFSTGLVGTIGVQIKQRAAVITARSVNDIIEVEPQSGTYQRIALVAPATPGQYSVVWDDDAGLFATEELYVEAIEAPALAPAGYDIALLQGDDYNRNDGRELVFTQQEDDVWPDLTGATIAFTCASRTTDNRFTKAGRVITPSGGAKVVGVELTKLETAGFDPALYNYSIEATLPSNRVITLRYGRMRVNVQP